MARIGSGELLYSVHSGSFSILEVQYKYNVQLRNTYVKYKLRSDYQGMAKLLVLCSSCFFEGGGCDEAAHANFLLFRSFSYLSLFLFGVVRSDRLANDR
jgi:hypothetical protein